MSFLNTLYFEVDGQTINLNQSRVQTYLRCHRKYGWFYHEHLQPDRPTYALSFGTAVHAALAEVASGKLTLDEALVHGIKVFKRQMPEGRFPGDDVIIEEHIDLMQRMLPAYYAHYEHDANPWKPIGLEVSGRIEVGTGTNVFLVFRTDELAFQDKMLWIVDHKTAARLDPRDMLKYELDLQMTAYTYAITKKLTQEAGRPVRVAGVIVNVLVKTAVPQFHRERFIRTDEELAEFEAEFVEIAREIKWRHARVAAGDPWKQVFYKNTNECFSYGTCYFRDLCLKDNDIRRMAYIPRKRDYVDDPSMLQEKTANPNDVPPTKEPV
jgi:hypothetical protein